MKKTDQQIYQDVANTMDVLLENVSAGFLQVGPDQEQKVADALAVLGKNMENNHSTLNADAYWMGVEVLAQHGQPETLKKLVAKMDADKPFALYKMPRNIMLSVGEGYFMTLPPKIGNVMFGGESRRTSAYIRMFTKDIVQSAEINAQEFKENNMYSVAGGRDDYEGEAGLLQANMDDMFQQAVKKSYEFKRKTGAERILA